MFLLLLFCLLLCSLSTSIDAYFTIVVVHFALGKQLSVVTDSGEIYTGSISKQYGSGGSSVSSGGRRRLGSDSPDPVILDHMTCYKMKSITCVQNATKIFTDFKGNNLAALQKIYG